MRIIPDSEAPIIRHDYKRATYRAMLSELPPEEIIEFFQKVPCIIDGRTVRGAELFQLLWNEKGMIPSCYDYGLDNCIERFMIEKGRNLQAVLHKILWLHNNSTHIPGKVLLTWFYPKLESIFNAVDARDMVFACISLFTENWLPNHIHRRVYWREEGEWVHSVMIFSADPTPVGLLEWDMDLVAGPQVLNGPVMFGLPPFESFGMVADCRDPHKVIWVDDDAPALKDGVLSIKGEEFAREVSFHEFCKQEELDLSKYKVSDDQVWLFTRDYTCPIRKRIVLYAGCVYKAPVFLHSVRHKRLKNTRKGVLGLFVADLVREETLQPSELDQKHNALMALLSREPKFEYFVQNESLTLDGQHFTRGVPAKILKHLIESYRKEAKCEFEYRDLKRIFDITQGQKNANFEVRFYRLIEKLNEESRGFRIKKTGRGRFRLEVTGSFQYRENAEIGAAPDPAKRHRS